MVRKAIIKSTILTLIGTVLLGLSSVGGNSGNVLAVESASMSSSGADFEITPTSANPNGTVAVGEDKLTISSTCSSGYTLYMSSAEDETALTDADNAENTIPSISGTISNPVLLNSADNKNHWGFALTSTGIGSLIGTGFNESSITSSSKFAGIPSSDSLSAIRESNTGTSGGASDNDEVSVYYAANAGTNLAPGNYSGSVLYTLVTPASCGYTLSFQADEENKDSAGNPLVGTIQSAGLANEFKDPGSTINLNDYRTQYRDSSGVVKDLTEGSTLPSGSTLTRGFYLEGYTQTGWTVKELDSLTNDVLATNTYSINASSVAKTNSNADLVIVMPTWTINQYTISANTSTGINSTEVNINSTTANVNNSEIKFGDTVTIKYTLTAGYAFKEWQITNVGTNQSGNPFLAKDDMTISSGSDSAGTSVYTFTMPASNVSLTAKAEGIKYNISFSNNTGTGTMNTIEVTYGDSATLPINTFTAPEHYEFYGWSTSAQTPTYEYADGVRKYTNGQTGVFNLTTTAGATVPLHALWIGKANTVTITKGDNVTNTTLGTNTTTNTSNSASYRYGQAVNINATVSTTGYNWNSWTINSPSGLTLNSANTTASNSFIMPDSTVAITASAAVNSFTVNVSGGYVGASGTSTSTTCSYGSSITIRANPSAGYHFTSWSSNNGGTFSSSTTASTTYNCTSNAAAGSSITLTAGSAVNSFTISTSGGYVGTSGTSTSTTCTYGDTISIRANPSTGYHFTSWSSNNGGSFNNSSSSSTTYTCSSTASNGSTITLTAGSAINSFSITVSGGYTGASGTSTTATCDYGGSVTIGANVDTGYHFTSWSSNNGGTFSSSTTANTTYNCTSTAGNGTTITLTANSSINSFTVSTSGGYVGTSGTSTSTSCNYGSSINIRANVDEGYHFTEWSSNNGGSFANSTTADTTYTCSSTAANGSTITLTRNQAANTYTIVYNANSGTGTAPSNQSVTYGGSVTLRANTFTRASYDFQGWNIGTSGDTETASYEENKSYSVSTLASAAGVTGTNGANINLYAVWKEEVIEIMQNWTGCTSLTISTMENYNNGGTYAKLLDTRNNVTYIVRRYSDQNCWMTQNLRLTPETSDPENNTVDSGVLFTTTSDSETDGSIVFTSSFSTSSTTQAIYKGDTTYGAYYSWEAAKLVCPAGWTLPTSTQYNNFLSKESIENSSTGSEKIRGAPYNFSYAGYYSGSSLSGDGSYGTYWSSTQSGSIVYALDIDSSYVRGGAYDVRKGYSVRCIQDSAPSTSMQDFKVSECAALVASTTENYNNTDTYTTRVDTRNNVTYTIRKYSDGLCWMAENLRVTPGSSDPGDNSVTSGTLSLNTFTSQNSGSVTFASSGFDSSTAGNSGLRAYYGGNTTYGAYYTWSAALTVCPAGWALPTNTQYANFLSKENISNSSAGSSKLRSAPYNFPYAGRYSSSAIDSGGSYAAYWTSTPNGDDYGYRLSFYDTSATMGYGGKHGGSSVRCIKIQPSTSMQDFRSDECADLVASTTENHNNTDTYTTRLDTRNNVTYTIRKYGDSKCWMTENLRVTPGSSAPTASITSGVLTTAVEDSQLSGGVTFVSEFSAENDNFVSEGRYDTSNASAATNTGYYSWKASTRVCPAGWTLPTKPEWQSFLSGESIGDNAAGSAKIQSSPYNFAISGYYFSGLGGTQSGNYWSATESGSGKGAYTLFFNNGFVNVSNTNGKQVGAPVRCIHS